MAYIPYFFSHQRIHAYEDGWWLVGTRNHWVKIPEAHPGAYWAIERCGVLEDPEQLLVPIEWFETDSPVGYAPTRKYPTDDIMTHGGRIDAESLYARSSEAPKPQTLRNLETFPNGAILKNPSHSLEVDRVWYWLARKYGLVAERDISAYITGWWQERDVVKSQYGANLLPFEKPQRLIGFHHPPESKKVMWHYLYHQISEVCPPFFGTKPTMPFTVEFCFGKTQPTHTVDLTTTLPRPRGNTRYPSQLSERTITAIQPDHTTSLSPCGQQIMDLPVETLALLFHRKMSLLSIAALAYDCAVWVTQNMPSDTPWTQAFLAYRTWLWKTKRHNQEK